MNSPDFDPNTRIPPDDCRKKARDLIARFDASTAPGEQAGLLHEAGEWLRRATKAKQ